MDHQLGLAAGRGNGGILERTRPVILSAALAAVAIVVTVVLWRTGRDPVAGRDLPVPGEAVELTVEVLNGTTVDGLAREVTRRLRRRGIDVVSFGTAARQDVDSTVILVRRGDSTAVRPVREALGAGRITVELDRRLLLDATILVGRDLTPAFDGNP